MNVVTRRRFISSTAFAIAATRLSAQSKSPVEVALSIPAQAKGAIVPADFAGLSYEIEQLTDPSFFSPQNASLIRAFKWLAPNGVLRLGGNTGEFSWWKPASSSAEPQHPVTREVVGEPKAEYYAVTAEAVRNLADFLKATGWSCIYGINMGTNTPERSADEAEFAAKTLGASLKYFQIGNEVDLFGRHLRDPQTWSAKTYLAEWLKMANAVAARVPGAQFGIPDVAGRIDWLTEIAAEWSSIEQPPRIVALTHHHYFGGPATNPDVNIPNLLKAATMAKVQATADIANAAAAKMGVPVRMTEGNTCYRGGKPGVSDVFAAALWAADYSLLLASNRYTGVNLHGGTGIVIANGLGGFLPGDQFLAAQGATPEQIASHPHPFYAPIAKFGAEYVIEPVAHGLKFAAKFSGAKLIDAGFTQELQAAGVNASAYAAKAPNGETAVIVLNKDAEQDLALRLDFGAVSNGAVMTETLRAAALDSREVQTERSTSAGPAKDGKLSILVPHASALLVSVS